MRGPRFLQAAARIDKELLGGDAGFPAGAGGFAFPAAPDPGIPGQAEADNPVCGAYPMYVCVPYVLRTTCSVFCPGRGTNKKKGGIIL